MKFKIVSVFLCLAVLSLVAPLPASAAYSQSQAVSYLKSRPLDEWSVMAIAAAGALDGVNLDFLKTPIATGRTTDYEKRILAIAAAGQNPGSFGQENFVAKLKGGFDGTQIGDPQLLNDDIFGILALAAAGEGNGSIAAAGKTFLLQKQNSDGGWGWAVGVPSDSNDTAMAVSALLSIGVSSSDQAVSRALNYLAALKQGDGGSSYDNSGFGSDSASTSWVAAALRKAGSSIPPDASGYLENQQLPDGSFRWQASDTSGSVLMTAYALITLAGKTYPVMAGSGNPGAPGFPVCIFGSAGRTIWSGFLSFGPPSRAIDTVSEAAKIGNFSYVITNTSFGPYVQAIAGEEAAGASGWMYQVNGTAPNVGAADYLLQNNDLVVWFYGQFGDAPPTCNVNATPGGGSASSQVGLSVTVDVPPANPVVAFVVAPSSLNFGTLKPGQSAGQTLTLTNTGTVNLTVSAQITDSGTLFRDNLRLDGLAWSNYRTSLATGQNRSTTATLQVPASFTASGVRNATLTFWATP